MTESKAKLAKTLLIAIVLLFRPDLLASMLFLRDYLDS